MPSEIRVDVHLEPLAEERNARLGDRLADEDPQLTHVRRS